MADYALERFAYELNFAGAKAAKKAVELDRQENPSRLFCRRRHGPDQSDLLDFDRCQ